MRMMSKGSSVTVTLNGSGASGEKENSEAVAAAAAAASSSAVGGGSSATAGKSVESNGVKNTTELANNNPRRDSTILPSFGSHTLVKTVGGFPGLGSILGPYFCVGKLGKGTFCSIHKCIDLSYFHKKSDESDGGRDPHSSCRTAAAKVEIGEFRNSGVLDGEAGMLQYLDCALPAKTVPVYMGHFRSGVDVSAIVMEYLPGQDMHVIRDWATRGRSRRIALEDAVYLTADVMLPLLQRMHEAGIVHRDVKPSNCVKRGVKDFCMVDFGLSKSIVVPKDSMLCDAERPWKGKDWMRPPNYKGEGHFRKERPSADFRGTSMYASVRVHQMKDYCPRDDMWSLLYVFCDLATGGLPWMSHAANRDREACRLLKERIHGEEEGRPDETERLLMGDHYHVALFKKYRGGIDPPEGSSPDDDGPMPDPLPLHRDRKKVALLRKAFNHLRTLSFWDKPDYELIRNSITGFLEGDIDNGSIVPIDWELLEKSTSRRKAEARPVLGRETPTWDLVEEVDPIDPAMFEEAEAAAASEVVETRPLGEAADMARLPLELRFRIAQMDYNALHHSTIAPHLALRDWMKVALPLTYGEWDTKRFERGGHRSDGDGYRRDLFVRIIEKCLDCAKKFNGFRHPECIYHVDRRNGEPSAGTKDNNNNNSNKRRKVSSSMAGPTKGSRGAELLAISQVNFRLLAAKKAEEKKPRAPPPLLSFGSSFR